jgi:hypothetical protein
MFVRTAVPPLEFEYNPTPLAPGPRTPWRTILGASQAPSRPGVREASAVCWSPARHQHFLGTLQRSIRVLHEVRMEKSRTIFGLWVENDYGVEISISKRIAR